MARACADMFPIGSYGKGSEELLRAYSESRLYDYLWIQVGIAVFGVLINVTPPVKNWVQCVHLSALLSNLEDASSTAKEEPSSNKDSEDNDADNEANDIVVVKTEGDKHLTA